MKTNQQTLPGSLLDPLEPPPRLGVDCLGLTFTDEDARRNYFLDQLRSKLNDPDFRQIEGFPVGTDEDILNLSDPPYYTACPNPFITDFIKHFGKPYDPSVPYSREPFASDVSEGKNDPIYNAHSYHTKVPHKAIMRYILHYTEPGDLVLDGFCGTGMTGVAAALAVGTDPDHNPGASASPDGPRKAILADLSPIATFIASNLLRPSDRNALLHAVDTLCDEVDREFGNLYSTRHTGWKVRDRKRADRHQQVNRDAQTGNIEFTLYSDIVRCPDCGLETTLYSVIVDEQSDSFRSVLQCPRCNAIVPESKWETVFSSVFDPVLKRTIQQIRIEPVLINYTVGSTRYEKAPDEDDQRLLTSAADFLGTHGLPAISLISGKETQRNVPIGVTHLHQFFTPREHLFVAVLLEKISEHQDSNLRNALLFALTASLPYTSRMRRFRADRKGGGPLSGTLYVGSLITPPHVLKTFRRNALTIADSLATPIDPGRGHIITTQDSGFLRDVPNNSVDYIFTDPPFGYNFDYSELNFFWEGFLKVITNQKNEAIVSSSQKKGIDEYRELMARSFSTFYRVLKPGRWLTVEFSNTKASVWNSIQSALTEAGFIIANVSVLDKQQGSFKAVTTPTAVKQDLVISAYKPNGGFEERFNKEAGKEEGVWDFVRTHLKYLPVVKRQGALLQIVAERDPRILFDQMIAFYVRKGYAVPISSQEFQAGLAQRFIERDGMYFLSEQAVEYDKKKLMFGEPLQASLFVSDESSAIQWIRARLKSRPQIYSEIQPDFMPLLSHLNKSERELMSLDLLLQDNFIRYDGAGDVPSQIHSYLSSNFKELRNLPKDSPGLRSKGKDRWYVPDPSRAADLEQLRERSLLKEFDQYRTTKQKKLKTFRIEAIRAGFKRCWQQNEYGIILSVADLISDDVLQEDPMLLMWYTNSLTRAGKQA
jgi:DNA modification methylase